MTQVSVAEIKARLSEYVSRALGGERIEITRRGQPVAVLLGPAEYKRMEVSIQPDSFARAAARFRASTDGAEDLPDLTPVVEERLIRSREVDL